MNHKSELYSSVPEIRQQVFEQWYEEWDTPEGPPTAAGALPALKPLAHLRGIISNLTRSMSNSENTPAPRSTLGAGETL